MEEPVPLQICNAPTKLMEDLGYNKNYEYSHDYPLHMTDMECLPPKLKGHSYYHPTDQGSESKVQRRMDQIAQIKEAIRRDPRLKKPAASQEDK